MIGYCKKIVKKMFVRYPFLEYAYIRWCIYYDEYTKFFRYHAFTLLRLKKHARGKTVGFYPQVPEPFYTISRICKYNGYRMTPLQEKADVVIYFEDATRRVPPPELETFHDTQKRVINFSCRDISKEHVDLLHKKIFGYNLAIQPHTYRGAYVKKANENAKHDGIILHKPEKKCDGYVYQRLVNNVCGEEIVDIRIPVFGPSIPFVFIKHRSIAIRFGCKNNKTTMEQPETMFSPAEHRKIMEFCRSIGLEYGEMDILRDNDTKKLYIVDVNNTPAGPPSGLSVKDSRTALHRLSEAFEQAFMSS